MSAFHACGVYANCAMYIGMLVLPSHSLRRGSRARMLSRPTQDEDRPLHLDLPTPVRFQATACEYPDRVRAIARVACSSSFWFPLALLACGCQWTPTGPWAA